MVLDFAKTPDPRFSQQVELPQLRSRSVRSEVRRPDGHLRCNFFGEFLQRQILRPWQRSGLNIHNAERTDWMSIAGSYRNTDVKSQKWRVYDKSVRCEATLLEPVFHNQWRIVSPQRWNTWIWHGRELAIAPGNYCLVRLVLNYNFLLLITQELLSAGLLQIRQILGFNRETIDPNAREAHRTIALIDHEFL